VNRCCVPHSPFSQTLDTQDTEDARVGSVDRTASREVTASNEKRKFEEEIAELNQKLVASSERQIELEQQLEGGEQETIAALRRELEERSVEIDTLRKKSNREVTVTVEPSRPTPLSPSSKYDLGAARDEIKGLKSVANSLSVSFSLIVAAFRHIIQELQKENQAVKQQAKLVESENQLLMHETEQLRQVGRPVPLTKQALIPDQEMKVLEEEVEKSIQREESRLDAEEQGYPDGVQKVVQELKSKHNVRKNFIDVCRSADNEGFSRARSSSYANA